jgi:hypothetical protein
VLGLTDAVDLSAIGLVTPMGAPGFWAGATAGMLVSSVGIVVYFFAVSASPPAAGAD